MYTPRIQSEQTDLLMHALLCIHDVEEAYRFCDDILSAQEFISIAQRLEVAVMLRKKVTYQEIAKKTGASTATISRVNRCLLYGANGYSKMLDRLENIDNNKPENSLI